ncbi:hypothetical protein [Pseudomonas sichuanensis]|uniref:hypothetical protein n=1 Tax=Pseudomonas sichuanensis TaxID=2213015 RepID=UPI00215FC637|nr:hypothetical protein [Pseudomonas sichuanensis]UVL89456.1 hypothetical protein LOY51_00675 [Pseudomonas sichuanensis]
MNSIPTFNSYSVADNKSSQIFQVTKPAEANLGNVPAVNEGAGRTESGNNVQISQEALDKYRNYAEALKAANSSGGKSGLSDGVQIVDPNALSEEESKKLVSSMSRDSLAIQLDEISKKFESIEVAYVRHRAVDDQIDKTYLDVLKKIATDHPDLKGASFGFSVSAAREIVLVNADELTKDQADRLLKVLNGSELLVKQANELADAQIAVFAAESFNDSSVEFNRRNYAKTIDISAQVLSRIEARNAPRDGSAVEVHQKNWNNNWRQQLWAKGERV